MDRRGNEGRYFSLPAHLLSLSSLSSLTLPPRPASPPQAEVRIAPIPRNRPLVVLKQKEEIRKGGSGERTPHFIIFFCPPSPGSRVKMTTVTPCAVAIRSNCEEMHTMRVLFVSVRVGVVESERDGGEITCGRCSFISRLSHTHGALRVITPCKQRRAACECEVV